ncbi:uncharacterized protein LOC128194667 [Vigna angularis]|uniref:uncharacterized protein LOC128194667 n=1 Tax=Phaseolus angularis TaxID=3914 RepID=UPI0022B4E92A|nr:uncharacterized protein LOC128194667 [Vigna angularis]
MNIKELWYGLRGQSVHPDRLELLTDDRGAMHMLNIARLNDEVHLYVVHNMMEPEIIEMIDWVGGQVDDEGDVARQVEEVEVEVIRDGQLGTEMVEGEGDAQDGDGLDHTAVGRKMVEGEDDAHEGEGDGYEGDGEDHSDVGTKRVEGEGEGNGEDHSDGGTKMVEGEGEGDGQDHSDVHEDVEIHHVEEAEVHDVDDFELEDYGEDDDVEDSEGDAHQAETEDEDVDSSEGSLIDVSVHCDIGTSKGNVGEQASSALLESERSTYNEFIDDMCGLSDNEWLSEELFSGSDSEDNHVRTKIRFPTFSMPKTLVGYKWEVGTYFTEKNEFTDAIRTYALSNGRSLKFIKNDKKRISVKCLGGRGNCKWYAYCSFRTDVSAWQLRKVFDVHNCSRDFNVKLMTSKWLSERMEKTVRENPTMKVMDIRDKVTRKWNVGISRNMVFRARAMARDKVEGSFKDQYRRLHDYGHELLKTNPGTTVQIKVDNSNGEVIFQRFYACLKACKDSFICCRPIIGLDGCFLKSKYGGELLTAVGRDGNDQMMPIAYAIVEVENKDSWTWFLEHLIEDLGGAAVCAGCTFISDQQKGLLPAIQDLLPGVEQRFCVRHLYSNFRKKFPGKNLKRLMWRAATATHPQQWETEMRNIRDINLDAFKYLLAIPPRFWSRSRFTSRSQCDTLVNNMCESFNSVLVDSRSKPIISMLEDIRVYIMKRWAANRTKITSYQGSICPKVFNRFQKESWLTRYWLPRKWAITGIPCTHAITAMKFLNINAEEYIGHWFRKSTYEETYNTIINPINGQHVWDVTPYADILPPKKRTMPGRPKKKRRLEDWELKKNNSELRKGGQRKTCAICKELGHNRKGCPQRPLTVEVPTAQSVQVTQPPATHVPISHQTTMPLSDE